MFLTQQDDLTPMEPNATENGRSALTDEAERHRLLAEMAERSTDMISRHTPDDWRFIYASPAVTHLLGYTVEEIIGVSAYELYHPDDVNNFKRRSSNVRYERGLYTHTYRFRRKDGRYIWLESTSRTLRSSETGELKEILVVSRDATRRIEANQTNQRLARVLESTSDLVLFISPTLELTHLNEAARKVLGQELVHSYRLTLNDVLSPTSYAQLQEEGFPTAIASSSWRGELTMKSSYGEAIPVHLELLAHKSYHDNVEYFSIVCRDLTQTKAQEEQLKQYELDINHASRLIAMGELSSSLAHELNQPLTSIVNYLRGISRRFSKQDNIAWQDIQQPINKAADAAMRAGAIIHRMMDFTRKGNSQFEPTEFNNVVNNIFEFCQTTADRHNITLANRIDLGSIWVYVDRIQLEQVLLNLVMNGIEACQAVKRNGATVWIEASLQPNQQLLVKVADEGPGLSASQAAKLFDSFYTTKEKGLGMGLSITRSLVESLGGELWVEHLPTAGAAFCFTLNITEPPNIEG